MDLFERILARVRQAFGLIVGNISHTQEFEDLEQRLAVVSERHRAVVGIALLDQDVAVEAAHLWNSEHANAAEGTGFHRQHLALGNVGPELTLAVALEAVEGNVAGGDVALQGAAGEVRFAVLWLQKSVLDQILSE